MSGDSAASDRAREHMGVIERAAALTSLSPDQITYRQRSGRWDRPRKGVYIVAGAPEGWHRDLHVALAAAGPGSAISHRAAALLYGLGRFPPLLELTTPRRRRLRMESAIVHTSTRFSAADIASIGSLAATTPERTLTDLGAVVSEHRVEEAIDVAIRDGLTSLDRLISRLRRLRGPGRRGAGVLASILDRRIPGPVPESKYERAFVRLVEGTALPAPDLQYVITNGNAFVARVDVAWPEQRVAVEIDSQQWHSTRKQRENDASRENAIKLAGWQVYRFTTDQIWAKPDEVLATLWRVLSVS